MILSFLTLLFLSPVQADYLDYTFLDNPEIKVLTNTGSRRLLKADCEGMKYNYLEELKKLQERKAQLDFAVQQPLTDSQLNLIKKLKAEVSEATVRLIFLAKPEWNTPVLNYSVTWWLPEEYLTTDRKVIRFKVTDLYYKGEIAGYLAPQFSKRFETYSVRHAGPVLPQIYTRQVLEYTATGTYLELCQFVATMEVEVQVDYIFVGWPASFGGKHLFFLKGRSP